MNWIPLEEPDQLAAILTKSESRSQVIFKHSTRCSISKMIKNRLEKSPQPEGIDFYYLDLLAHRKLSDHIAETFHIRHESPQIILIKKGIPLYNEDHSAIYMEDIIESAAIMGS